MKIALIKAPPYYTGNTMTAIWCDNPECRHLPEYFIEPHPTGQTGRCAIKEGVTVARLDLNMGAIQNRIIYFCTDCIDLVLQDVRRVMDKRLWAFH